MSMQTLVTAVLTPDTSFIRFADTESSSVCLFISASLLLPVPYWIICCIPLKLSSTKLLSSPDFVRKSIPSLPLTFDIMSGITTPVTIYAASATIANIQ